MGSDSGTTPNTPARDGDIDRQWWKEAVVYQIYPQSFNDSNGDGVGDIPGIIEKVDYLDDLGIDVVWLTPAYASPMADNGYDISDYRSIHPKFGSMADWEQLLEELHNRDMRLIMDLVVNHTSDEHEWFMRSREESGQYDEYYYWRDGNDTDTAASTPNSDATDRRPPNNWESFFEESAWTYDDHREQYYLQLFDRKQPDLNWGNDDVREDIYEMMNWWLDKGIDGFRMDVINLISKTEGLPDGDPDHWMRGAEHFVSGPDFQKYLQEMVSRTVDNYDVMTVGEMIGVDAEEARNYVGEDGLSMIIHFEHMNVDTDGGGRWDVTSLDLLELKKVITDWQEELSDVGWNCLYLSNHDQPRAISRFGDDDEYRVESGKMLATFLFTLQGTPFLFQGQEIGMTNTSFETRDDIQDVAAANAVERMLDTNEYETYEEVRPLVESRSRDNARTPMQWDDTRYAGFSTNEPWIPVNENYNRVNAATARESADSIWQYYQKLIKLREYHDVFVYGDYELLLSDHPDVFAYRRTLKESGEQLLIACNFSATEQQISLPPVNQESTELLIGNYPNGNPSTKEMSLRPYEARVYKQQNKIDYRN